MGDQDPVDPGTETPAENAEALGDPGQTQGDAPASSTPEGEGTTTEPAGPSVEDQLTASKAATEKAERGYRELQGRLQGAEAELAPHRQREAEARAKLTADDTTFSDRCEQQGYAKTYAEVARNEAVAVMQQQSQVQVQASQDASDGSVYDEMRAMWREAGKPEAGFVPFIQENIGVNGFKGTGMSYDKAREVFATLLGGKEALKVNGEVQEARERRAETNAARKAANQPARGEVTTGVPPARASEGEAVIAGMERVAKAAMEAAEEM